jgi:hypothetical protein
VVVLIRVRDCMGGGEHFALKSKGNLGVAICELQMLKTIYDKLHSERSA